MVYLETTSSVIKTSEAIEAALIPQWPQRPQAVLYVTASPLHASGEHAADEDADDLEEGDADADPSDNGNLVDDELLEELDAAVLIDLAQVGFRAEHAVAY